MATTFDLPEKIYLRAGLWYMGTGFYYSIDDACDVLDRASEEVLSRKVEHLLKTGAAKLLEEDDYLNILKQELKEVDLKRNDILTKINELSGNKN